MKLSELSAKASQGVWEPGHLADPTTSCNCRSILTDQMFGCVMTTPNPEKIEERFRDEYPTNEESAANMVFVCELVNAFRAGRLVERSEPCGE